MGMRMIPFLYRVGSGASGDKKKFLEPAHPSLGVRLR